MSLFTVNLTTIQAAILHAVGKPGGLPTGDVTTDIANEAMRTLTLFHPWSWLFTTASLDVTNGQSYVDAPADLAELLYLRATGANNDALPRSYDQILQLRQLSLTDNSTNKTTVYCLTGKAQAAASSASGYRIELYPTPTADGTGYFTIAYRRQPAAMSAGSDVPDCPARFHGVVLSLARAIAQLREWGRMTDEWGFAQDAMARLAARDPMVVPEVGQSVGTVYQHDSQGQAIQAGSRFSDGSPVTL